MEMSPISVANETAEIARTCKLSDSSCERFILVINIANGNACDRGPPASLAASVYI